MTKKVALERTKRVVMMCSSFREIAVLRNVKYKDAAQGIRARRGEKSRGERES